MSTALKQAAARVESDFQIPIDVVTVGDVAVDDRTRALVLAAAEAMVNAAKHARVDRISSLSMFARACSIPLLARSARIAIDNDYFDFATPPRQRSDDNYTQGLRIAWDTSWTPRFDNPVPSAIRWRVGPGTGTAFA